MVELLRVLQEAAIERGIGPRGGNSLSQDSGNDNDNTIRKIYNKMKNETEIEMFSVQRLES